MNDTVAAARPAATPSYRASLIPELRTHVERRPDGCLILRSANPVRDIPQRCFSEFVPMWAQQRGAVAALCERDAQGEWRKLTWAQLWQQVQSVAVALLDLGLGPGRPLMMLSGNSIEQAVLFLAAEHAGIPVAPVSPAYSLRGAPEFTRLKAVSELCPPAALFVQSTPDFAPALAALAAAGVPVIAVDGAAPDMLRYAGLAATPLTQENLARLAAAHAAIADEHVTRVLFTSGSTGAPKGVVTTYGTMRFLLGFADSVFGRLTEHEPVYLDWLPWHHAFGLLINLNRTFFTGGTHYIDDGRPMPGLFDRTVRNLREVSPTLFNNVPAAWVMLATELERDPELARSLFAKASNFGYGGASLPREVWQRIQNVAVQTIGQRIQFQSGLASTETAVSGTINPAVGDDLGNIGVPSPGSQVKLVPLEGGDGRYEIRMKLPFEFVGYLKRPDLTAASLDDEGYFCIGDAVRLADPADPSRGLHFAGRVVEDFKLVNGTWVRTGAVRLALLDLCAPLLADAVICGHDQTYVAALAWPDVAACRRLAPELAQLDPKALVDHPLVVHELSRRLSQQSGSASLKVERLMLMAEPPSLDANEIADKGYVNQAATRARRAHLVDALFEAVPAGRVAIAR